MFFHEKTCVFMKKHRALQAWAEKEDRHTDLGPRPRLRSSQPSRKLRPPVARGKPQQVKCEKHEVHIDL